MTDPMTRTRFSLFSPAAGLLLVMALTRYQHFGSALSLPDASLAVFFLAAWSGAGRDWFLALLAAAGLIDYVAISQFGVSDYCVSAAYAFLIPAYGVMWLGGAYSRRLGWSWLAGLRGLGAAFAAGSSAFLLSSAGFYWFSGKIAAPSLAGFVDGNADYYLAYVSAALLYVILGVAAAALGRALSGAKAVKAV